MSIVCLDKWFQLEKLSLLSMVYLGSEHESISNVYLINKRRNHSVFTQSCTNLPFPSNS